MTMLAASDIRTMSIAVRMAIDNGLVPYLPRAVSRSLSM
jgi:hypothetical protein